MLQTNQAILTQSAQTIDTALKNAGTFCLDLSMKENISSLLYVRQPLDDLQRYQISETLRKDLKNVASPRYFSAYFICFNYGDFVLTPSARYMPEIAYQSYFARSPYSFEGWRALMKERHFQQTLDLGETLLYLQTIPYTGTQAAANIAVLLDKEQLLALLSGIEWVERGMFFAVDETGKVVLTNRSPAAWEELGLGLSGHEMPEGRLRGKKMVASCCSSENGWSYYLVMDNDYLKTANEGKESHNTVLLERILRYLWENYSDSGLNNEQIAREIDISPAYLSRFFKQQTGEGLLSTISRIRIEEAKSCWAGRNGRRSPGWGRPSGSKMSPPLSASLKNMKASRPVNIPA